MKKNNVLLILACLLLLGVVVLFVADSDFSFRDIKDKIDNVIDVVIDNNGFNDDNDDESSGGSDIDYTQKSTLFISAGVIDYLSVKRGGAEWQSFIKGSLGEEWYEYQLDNANDIQFSNTSTDRTYYIGLTAYGDSFDEFAPGEILTYYEWNNNTYYIWNDQEPKEDVYSYIYLTYDDLLGRVYVKPSNGEQITLSQKENKIPSSDAIMILNGIFDQDIVIKNDNGEIVSSLHGTGKVTLPFYDVKYYISLDYSTPEPDPEENYSYIYVDEEVGETVDIYYGENDPLTLSVGENKFDSIESVSIENGSTYSIDIKDGSDNIVGSLDPYDTKTFAFSGVKYYISIVTG